MKGEARTKRRHDPDLTKSLILDAAKKEFAEKGFDGARIDQIAATANVNKQLIYYYFDNKDTLFTMFCRPRTRIFVPKRPHWNSIICLPATRYLN